MTRALADVSHSVQRVGLMGWPVEHSVSPPMHNAAFDALGLGWDYGLLPTPPGEVESVLSGLKAPGFHGANVTVPHKQAVMPYLDRITSAASAIGAVNTIVSQGQQLLGHNTDGDGFLAALREAGFQPSGKRALLLGAGGAARAVVYALAGAGCAVTIYNRTLARAQKLGLEMDSLDLPAPVSATPGGATLADLDLAPFDLLVHATAVGMQPHIDACPWPEALALPAHWAIYDLVYNPQETRLLSRARAAGATAIGGLGMLVHQGALAFELWTGQTPPIDVMQVAAQKALLAYHG